MFESIMRINLNNKLFRKALIKKLKNGSSKYESNREQDLIDAEFLSHWPEKTKEEKEEFIQYIINSPSFNDGIAEGNKLKEKIKRAPGSAFTKIKSVFSKKE